MRPVLRPHLPSPCNLQRWAMGNTCLRQAWRGWALYWRVEYSTARPRSSGTREIRKLPAAMSQQCGVIYLVGGWWHYRAKETSSRCANTKSWIFMEVWRSVSRRTVDSLTNRQSGITLWRYDALQSCRQLPPFRRNMLPLSSWQKKRFPPKRR